MIDDTLVILIAAVVAWSVVELLNHLPVGFRISTNRLTVRRWLRRRADVLRDEYFTLEMQLVAVATGGNDIALYRLESDQLSAQINAAAEIVLDRPRRHQELLGALAGVDPPERSIGDLEMFFSADSTLPGEEANPRIMQMRHELTLMVHRRLDDLQITTRSRQYIVNQVQHTLIALLATTAFVPDDRRIAVLGVIAGFVSPVIARIIKAVRT